MTTTMSKDSAIEQLQRMGIPYIGPAEWEILKPPELELGAQLLFGQLVSLGVERVAGRLRLGLQRRAGLPPRGWRPPRRRRRAGAARS
jgi:hypothetical protein